LVKGLGVLRQSRGVPHLTESFDDEVASPFVDSELLDFGSMPLE
jgi:hypothetical protein